MNLAAPAHRRRTSSVVVPAVVGAVLGATAALIWGLTVSGLHGVVVKSGIAVLRQGQDDKMFVSIASFVGFSLVSGLLTGAVLFRGSRRTPQGVAVTLAAAAFGVLIAVLLGQAVVDARFPGPGAVGLDFTAAPSIRLDGANLLAPADHSGGELGTLASWVLVLVWPGATALWCAFAAAFGRLPDAPAPSSVELDSAARSIDARSAPGVAAE